LEHYAADTEGHRLATNRAVPMLYPELRQKFGKDVTYWDNPVAHVRTEFGFDVMQVATGRYAPDRYRSFIGFQVSRELLERVFKDTYGIEMKDVFGNVTLAIGSYRFAVRSIVPGMTKVAWKLKQEQLKKEIPGITRQKFLYNLSRSSYENEWGTEYRKPGLCTRILAFLFRWLPGGGPFSALKVRTPTPEVEKLFMLSFNATVDRYKMVLPNADAGANVPNENLDVGGTIVAGKYKGPDEAYAKLLGKLADRQFAGVPPELRQNILAFYKDAKPASATSSKKEKAKAAKLIELVDRLKATSEREP
jgi:hypothetical protein